MFWVVKYKIMKTLIIFEGVASSGKTTLEDLLLEQTKDAELITEDATLMPLIDNTDIKVAKKHLKEVLDKINSMSVPIVLLDRFHLTHIFRTKSDLDTFQEIEEYLIKQRKGGILQSSARTAEDNGGEE